MNKALSAGEVESRQTWRTKARSLGLNPESPIYAIGFSRPFRTYVKRFFQGSPIRFVPSGHQVPAGHVAVIWGRKHPEGLNNQCILLRVEDGFLRSVGLGIQFAAPLSWVVDSKGLYFDATGPSDIEVILNHQDFSAGVLKRAAQLREAICAGRISKYNTAGKPWVRPEHPEVILVPGQVESDASIAWGATRIRTNLELVQAVRVANPDAWVVYKPHPDVVAGARIAGSSESEISRYCDQIEAHASLNDMLEQCDEVHVNTSLTGFEALLRHKSVTCYGLPFYAGWGLTTDISPCQRRKRERTLDELVAATLIEYPLYVSRASGEHTTPEDILNELTLWREQSHTWTHRFRAHCGKAIRNLANLLTGTK
ncbi:beta-3-deoxy-D-manno-oct-2-ulosonic acid transferase [Marinobacter salinexigens]|uniref:Beta-3-deoxy-D-manno-oct-2-ulosonic acid transferase n=1 Tax=Marinobacter salinexigens TaxID=2919747 RepID=A0A5B0VJ47_9GAMM|nr:beta-3-deoxy-D-manno-oct-2-ulosonic acid transferase [Marinobacter salinexigens]KAA1174672.1 beta-3-deoxy-D-manno-oct-2-ulosonic acid transferase [Marinobacter salinexigens]